MLTGSICVGLVYLDDIVVMGDSWDHHCTNLRRVLVRLQKVNLSLKLSKCSFFKREAEYLKHVVTEHGIKSQQCYSQGNERVPTIMCA